MAAGAPSDAIEHVENVDELITGEAVALSLRPTSFILRAAGTAIDFLVYVIGYVGLFLLIQLVSGQLGWDDAIKRAASLVTLVVCLLIAPIVVETLSHGKSLGRLAVGARIVRDDGGAIGLRHATIRSLLGLIEIYGTFGGLAAIVGLLNSRAKRLGDLLAGTYSLNERVAHTERAVFGVPIQLVGWSRTADVARLPDALARRVAAFLVQAGGFTPETRRRMGMSLATEVSVYVSPVPNSDPELFLAAVSVLRRDRESRALQLEKEALDRLAPVLRGMPRGFPDRG